MLPPVLVHLSSSIRSRRVAGSCVCVCVCACVRACVRSCVCVCVCEKRVTSAVQPLQFMWFCAARFCVLDQTLSS